MDRINDIYEKNKEFAYECKKILRSETEEHLNAALNAIREHEEKVSSDRRLDEEYVMLAFENSLRLDDYIDRFSIVCDDIANTFNEAVSEMCNSSQKTPSLFEACNQMNYAISKIRECLVFEMAVNRPLLFDIAQIRLASETFFNMTDETVYDKRDIERAKDLFEQLLDLVEEVFNSDDYKTDMEYRIDVTQSKLDKLLSLLANYEYRHEITVIRTFIEQLAVIAKNKIECDDRLQKNNIDNIF